MSALRVGVVPVDDGQLEVAGGTDRDPTEQLHRGNVGEAKVDGVAADEGVVLRHPVQRSHRVEARDALLVRGLSHLHHDEVRGARRCRGLDAGRRHLEVAIDGLHGEVEGA
eukprot:CAMPEP_0170332820 /NCGR_PEP_ID=MMETSP0116_2-20130129/67422_1 /TAXON_ID=400756 /ORGANISM="Durinskia baltica, Strain CSIRO CS-38" /LENGTH=110 /DNA_ID=CAMNT_0010586147 /DNA_START=88 /DNA_END=415 /DNA_ORIENTATION=+